MTVRLVPVQPSEDRAAHVPVCGHCGNAWPCRTARRVRAERHAAEARMMDCWACGKTAKSATSWLVLSQRGGLVLAVFCGPAKHRRCAEVRWLYAEADRAARAALDITPRVWA